MKMMFNAFAKKLFGAKYERLIKTLFVCLIVFLGLHSAGFQIRIAPSVRYLMVSTFTVGVMWQALSSEENAANMQNLLMLPFEGRKFVLSYLAALGAYTFLTKTAVLLAVVLAVSVWNGTELLGSVLCAISAILMTACIYSLKKYWYAGCIWAVFVTSVILFLCDRAWFLSMIGVNGIFAFLVLQNADGYSFYLASRPCTTAPMSRLPFRDCLQKGKSSRNFQVLRYLFRYLSAHKNDLMNIVAMWCVACVLPLLFRQVENTFALPLGFAILSINTPICILLSCDPALEQAVRFLPGGEKSFCVPYGLFIFLCNMTADGIFLCSFQIQIGGVTMLMLAAAVFFALQSAVCSVLLEWFCPIRSWKIESDLWHHPRKYVVPAVMILCAGVVGTAPMITPVLIILPVVEMLMCNSSDTFTVTSKNSCKIAVGDEFLPVSTTFSYGICSKCKYLSELLR